MLTLIGTLGYIRGSWKTFTVLTPYFVLSTSHLLSSPTSCTVANLNTSLFSWATFHDTKSHLQFNILRTKH
jgi:hypothetical protein